MKSMFFLLFFCGSVQAQLVKVELNADRFYAAARDVSFQLGNEVATAFNEKTLTLYLDSPLTKVAGPWDFVQRINPANPDEEPPFISFDKVNQLKVDKEKLFIESNFGQVYVRLSDVYSIPSIDTAFLAFIRTHFPGGLNKASCYNFADVAMASLFPDVVQIPGKGGAFRDEQLKEPFPATKTRLNGDTLMLSDRVPIECYPGNFYGFTLYYELSHNKSEYLMRLKSAGVITVMSVQLADIHLNGFYTDAKSYEKLAQSNERVSVIGTFILTHHMTEGWARY